MANMRILANATYIPLAFVGVLHWGNASCMFRVGGNANFSVFKYHHVGIPNKKFRVGGLSQREDQTPVFLRRSGI